MNLEKKLLVELKKAEPDLREVQKILEQIRKEANNGGATKKTN